jgi:hypothetical protein
MNSMPLNSIYRIIYPTMSVFQKTMRFGAFMLCLCLGCRFVEGAAQFSATTNRQEISTFILGEPIVITFAVKGATEPSLNVEIKVTDEYNQVIETKQLPLEINAQNGTAIYNAPNGKYGFYRIYAKLSNGVTLPEVGSRFAGMITYCVVVDPTRRALYPSEESYFGMQGGFSQKTLKLLPYLGVRWVMDGGYAWNRNDAARPGEFAEKLTATKAGGRSIPPPVNETFTAEKAIVNGKPVDWKLYASACQILAAPKWAWLVDKPSSNGCGGAISPDAEPKASEYAELVGHTLSKNYPDESRHVYEITWEPMYPWGYTGTPDNLVNTYKIAYEALHNADPKAVIVGPASAGLDTLEWHEELFKRGLGRYLDGVSIHPYQKLPPERNGMIRTVRKLKEIIRKYSGKDIPLYGTESGYARGGSVDEDLFQAYGLIRHNLIFMGEGARSNFAFYIHDIVENGSAGYGYFYSLSPKNKNGNLDFGSPTVAPKPIAPAFAAMSYLLDGHGSAGPIDWMGGTSYGYVYDRPDDIVMALWDYGDTPREVSLPVGVEKVEVFDWMGNAQSVACIKGVFKTTLTQAPIYVKGVSAKLWGRNAFRPLKLKENPVRTYPGDLLTIDGTVQLPSGNIDNATLTIEFDKALQIQPITQGIKAKAGKRIPFKAEVPLNAKIAPGNYGISVYLKDNGNAIAGTGTTVEIQPAVTVDGIKPLFKGSAPCGVEVALQNRKNTPCNGTLDVTIKGVPETHKNVGFVIAPQQTLRKQIDYPDLVVSPLSKYDAKAEVLFDNGAVITSAHSIDFLPAMKLSAPPVIDGTLDEWRKLSSYKLKGVPFVVRSAKYYAGASADFRCAWDKNALYMTWEVREENIFLPVSHQLLWKGESIQFAIDLDNAKKTVDTGNGVADREAHRFTSLDIALTSDGPTAWCNKGATGGLNPNEVIPQEKLKLSVARTGDHELIYEVAVPWSSLGADLAPKTGDSIGISVEIHNLNKADQGAPSALGFGNIHDFKNQMTLILVDPQN